jgi:hypothetical protein
MTVTRKHILSETMWASHTNDEIQIGYTYGRTTHLCSFTFACAIHGTWRLEIKLLPSPSHQIQVASESRVSKLATQVRFESPTQAESSSGMRQQKSMHG